MQGQATAIHHSDSLRSCQCCNGKPADMPAVKTQNACQQEPLSHHGNLQNLWADADAGKKAPAAEALRANLRKCVGTLLGQLYDRNTRRSFAPVEAFHAEGLPKGQGAATSAQAAGWLTTTGSTHGRVGAVLRWGPLMSPMPPVVLAHRPPALPSSRIRWSVACCIECACLLSSQQHSTCHCCSPLASW